MTAQFQDTVHLGAAAYALTAIDGTGLFDPAAHSLTPTALSSACWRGFICTYRVEQDALLLTHLEIALSKEQHSQRPPLLFGQAATIAPAKAIHPGALRYMVAAPIAFTGRLLLGAKRVSGIYLNMGFQPAWLYRDVHELTLADGRLLSMIDHSSFAAEARATLGQDGAKPLPGEPTGDWIERTFSRTFDYNWPLHPTT
jgi:hypothetical protein